MNTGVCVSFQINVFIFSHTFWSEIAGSNAGSILVFWGTSILFSTVATSIHIPDNSVHAFPFLHISCWLSLFVSFLMIATLKVWGDIVLFWFAFSLIISCVELLLKCLLAIRMSSLKKGLSKTSAHFFYWIVSFWFSAVWAVYIFWILTPCWLYHLQIFSPIPIGCLFILLMISSAVQKPLIRCHLFIFTFISFALRDRSKKNIAPIYVRVLPMFSSRSSMASDFTFRSLIHFWFIQFFFYGASKCSNLILLHVAVQFSQHCLLKWLSFLHCIFLLPLL